MDIDSDHASMWTVSEAKIRLSEILRRARENGPQLIGKHSTCVVVSKEEWDAITHPEESLVGWLVAHSPKVDFELPERGQSTNRTLPFAD